MIRLITDPVSRPEQQTVLESLLKKTTRAAMRGHRRNHSFTDLHKVNLSNRKQGDNRRSEGNRHNVVSVMIVAFPKRNVLGERSGWPSVRVGRPGHREGILVN